MKSINLVLCILFALIQLDNCLNPYRILGLPKHSSIKAVKDAFKKLAKEYHPDKHQNNPNLEAIKEKMRSINEAYEMIKTKNYSDSESDEDRENQVTNEPLSMIEKLIKLAITLVIAAVIQKCIGPAFSGLFELSHYASTFSIFFYILLRFSQKYLDHMFDEEDEHKVISVLAALPFTILYTYLADYKSDHAKQIYKANESDKETEKLDQEEKAV